MAVNISTTCDVVQFQKLSGCFSATFTFSAIMRQHGGVNSFPPFTTASQVVLVTIGAAKFAIQFFTAKWADSCQLIFAVLLQFACRCLGATINTGNQPRSHWLPTRTQAQFPMPRTPSNLVF